MARKLRVQYAGTIYHVLNRGDRREAIFRDDTDRTRFWDTLEQTGAKPGWQVNSTSKGKASYENIRNRPRLPLTRLATCRGSLIASDIRRQYAPRKQPDTQR